jgi:hypothetical protein
MSYQPKPNDTEAQRHHKKGHGLGIILVDFVIIAFSAALAFYQALNSVVIFQYAGSGFQFNNNNLVESVIILVIFLFGISRLVIDLRSREF